MRTETTTRTLYKFEELPEETREKVIENLYDINVNYDEWSESVIDDAKTIGALMGIDITNIYWSGFFSQGDGACFEGRFDQTRGALKAVKEYAPKDKELHRIAKGLQTLKPFGIYANVKHSGHYYHEGCTNIDVLHDEKEITAEQEEACIELLRDFMKWIYKMLNADYDYLTSEEAIVETINANEFEFDSQGNLA